MKEKTIHWSFRSLYLLCLLFFGGLEMHSDFLHFRENPLTTALIVLGGTFYWATFYLLALIGHDVLGKE